METKQETKSVRGRISDLQVNGEVILTRPKHIPSSVRSTASSISADTGRKFTVSVTTERITVTRNS